MAEEAASGAAPEFEIQHPSLWQLFTAFLRLGLTAFGGPAMVPYIGEMSIVRMQWLSRPSFKEGVAVAQTIPGATAMQVAAYVGLRSRGVAGAAATYIGFGLPAFVLMVVLSAVYGVTHTSPISKSVFEGLQVIVVAIIARAVFTFARTTVKSWQDVVIALVAAGYLMYGGNPMLVVALGAAAGLGLYARTSGGQGADEPKGGAPLKPTMLPVLLIVAATVAGLGGLYWADRRLFDLSALMLRIDLFAFGGGFASVPLMLHEVVGVRQWMNTAAFMDGIAMGQVTPGPIVITATFIGYQVAGLAGAVLATVAVFLPSFLILILVVPHFDRMKRNPWVQRLLRGILAGFVGLLVAVLVKFGLAAPWSVPSVLLAGGAFTALMLKVDVPWVVLPGALISALVLHHIGG